MERFKALYLIGIAIMTVNLVFTPCSPEARIDVIPDSDQLNQPITREEAIQTLKTAPTNKAVGVDSIDPCYLQHECFF